LPGARERNVEENTIELARVLVERARDAEPLLPDAAFWDERLLEFCMRHPELKAQLFRFIDVLPALPPDEVTGHLLEYLGSAREDLPLPIRWGVGLTSGEGRLARVVGWSARRNVMRMARRFIAGSSVAELGRTVTGLREKKLAVTLDALGEAVLTGAEADGYRDLYLGLLRDMPKALGGVPEEPLVDRDHDGTRLPRVNVSVKLSALTPLFDPIDPDGVARDVVPRFEAILDAAAATGAFVHVDMEQYERKDLTLAIFQDVLGSAKYRNLANVGIVLQAYLKDAEQDLKKLAEWAKQRGTPVWVRLVKGAYWDSETVLARQQGFPVPVWEEKWQTDACYERMTNLLLDRTEVLRPAFASHNVRSLAHALASAQTRGLPPRFVEFQALYGMADGLKAALASLGQRVRVYAPFGQLIPGMAYLVRRLLENTSNESFVRHELVSDAEALEALFQPPSPPGPTPQKISSSAPPPREKAPTMTPIETRLPPFENEPLQDFARSEVRDQFRAAIRAVRADAGIHCPLVVAGRSIDTAERILSVSPSDASRVLAASSSAGREHADLAVAAAVDGFAEWRSTPPEERARILERAAELFVSRKGELSAWACLEAGKPWRDADADVAEAIDFCRFYARELRALGSPERYRLEGEDNVTTYAPRGPTVVISPWNFPLAILTGMAGAALVTGNPVILKPAEQTPGCAYHVFRLFLEAGVPPSALHFLPGPGETVGARLVEHPEVATIAFTGSRAVGHQIARRAAETSTGSAGIKHVIAEMGGKNAIIVDDDADLDESIPGILASAFGYAGQKCSAASRLIVIGRIYEDLLARLAQAAGALVTGPADDPAASIGPLIDADSVTRLERYGALAAEEGRIVFRGALGQGTAKGYFVPPLIVADVLPGSRLAQEEVFGPLLTVFHAKDLSEALAIANGTSYALTGGFYSRSPEHIARVRRDFDVGNLYINRKITGALVARQPFGGHRHSGTGGKAGGRDYLLHFVVARTVTENTLRRGFAPEESRG
jgi:RHH-type proline utilization regulon transcriptional repressor/proline dehydrogenase/delta 1-pyrroline-5-carboxylate dehydrogenase